MNGFLNILKEVGRYCLKNSVWLIPAVKTVVNTIKELFTYKKNNDGKPEKSS